MESSGDIARSSGFLFPQAETTTRQAATAIVLQMGKHDIFLNIRSIIILNRSNRTNRLSFPRNQSLGGEQIQHKKTRLMIILCPGHIRSDIYLPISRYLP